MTRIKKKWKQIKIVKVSDFYQIYLDKNILKTPSDKNLVIKNFKIAKEMFNEWNPEGNYLILEKMVFYSVFSTAIDRISKNRNKYIDEILNFIDTDMTCYRAEAPTELIEIQKKYWNPLLIYIEKYIGLKIKTNKGIMPFKQDKQIHIKFKTLLFKLNDLELSIIHRFANITGSFFISFYNLKKNLTKNKIIKICFLDEIWQNSKWGSEEAAASKREKITSELFRIAKLVKLLNNEF